MRGAGGNFSPEKIGWIASLFLLNYEGLPFHILVKILFIILKRVTSSLESRGVVKLFIRNLKGLRYSTGGASFTSDIICDNYID